MRAGGKKGPDEHIESVADVNPCSDLLRLVVASIPLLVVYFAGHGITDVVLPKVLGLRNLFNVEHVSGVLHLGEARQGGRLVAVSWKELLPGRDLGQRQSVVTTRERNLSLSSQSSLPRSRVPLSHVVFLLSSCRTSP